MSVQSAVVVAALRAGRLRRQLASQRVFEARVAAAQRAPHKPPALVRRRVRVELGESNGWPCYTVTPRGGATSKLHVLYLHGGSYIFQIIRHEWNLIASLVRRLGCTVVVPIFPLPPSVRAEELFTGVLAIYRDLLERVPAPDLAVAGDSAGGGLTLALAQLARAERLPQPRDLVLFAPWLDLALDDPRIPAVERRDPMLAVSGLRQAGRLYAGDAPLDDPLLSPVHADLTGLGRISLFIGGRDLFLPDARTFRDRAEAQGVHIDYFEYPEMFHVWMAVAALPESRQAMAETVALLTR